MNYLNRFNWIAPYYDNLTRLVFGDAIWKAQTGHLNYIPKNASVLVLGGGSGKWLIDLVQVNKTCKVCYVEASSKMIELAKGNLSDSGRVKFIHGTERDLPDQIFDVVITHFFLDMFTNQQLTQLVVQIKSVTNRNVCWLVADFEKSKWWQVLFSQIMYLFFNLTNSIDVRSLPNWNSVLIQSSFKCIDSSSHYGGFIQSRVYRSERNTDLR